MRSNDPEVPLQISQLESERDLKRFSGLLVSTFFEARQGESFIRRFSMRRRAHKSLLAFLQTLKCDTQVASVAFFDERSDEFRRVMDTHLIWTRPLQKTFTNEQVKAAEDSFSGIRDLRPFPVLRMVDPELVPSLDILVMRAEDRMKKFHNATTRVVACGQFQR